MSSREDNPLDKKAVHALLNSIADTISNDINPERKQAASSISNDNHHTSTHLSLLDSIDQALVKQNNESNNKVKIKTAPEATSDFDTLIQQRIDASIHSWMEQHLEETIVNILAKQPLKSDDIE